MNSAVRSRKQGEGQRDVPVRFGGLAWVPGQYVYADEDGVVVTDGMLHDAT
jgi:regulator of ribonuclease activity A